MEDNNLMTIVSNSIRTNLLIHTSQEISLLSPSQRIKINSETYQELASKFERYMIIEKDVISNSPNKQCGNSFLDTLEDSGNSSYRNPMIGSESPIDLQIKSKKITFSQRKLGIPKGGRQESSNKLISTDQKTIQINATKNMRLIAKALKLAIPMQLSQSQIQSQYQKQIQVQQQGKPNAKLNKHYSELNLLQKKIRTETKKCLDRVYFSLNKKKEIVVKSKESNNNSNCNNTPSKSNNNKSVIMLHRCSVTDIQERSHRKKGQKGNKIKHSSRSNNINQIIFDVE